MGFKEKLKLELEKIDNGEDDGTESSVLRPMFKIKGFSPLCAELKERFFNNLERLDEEFPPDKSDWKQLGENLALHKPEYLEKYKDCFKGEHWPFIIRMLKYCHPELVKDTFTIILEYTKTNKDTFKISDWFYILSTFKLFGDFCYLEEITNILLQKGKKDETLEEYINLYSLFKV